MPNTLEWLQAGTSLGECQTKTPLDGIDTRILLMHALGLSRVDLITQSTRQINFAEAQTLRDLIARRFGGEPIAYLVGEREFYSLGFHVTSDVLIPRPETELLVELALQHAPQGSRLLDMGTGSGAIAVAIAYTRRDLHVSASDISAAAIAVAKSNAARHLPAGAMQIFESDWYSACEGQIYQTIVGNPPYIEKDDPHLLQGDLRYEPMVALSDQSDGLAHYRQIIGNAGKYLDAKGWLLLEHGYNQAEQVQSLLRENGFTAVQSWQDLAGIWRVSGGQKISS
jgi:release factor glutamine methyltransferase